MKKTIILFFTIISFFYSKNISVKLDEEGINKFIKTVGSFSKTAKILNSEINWEIYDAKLSLKETPPLFTAKLYIITENKVRNGTIVGEAKFKFDPNKQTLVVDIDNMKVRGVDVFNLASLYRPKYELPIKIMQKEKIAVKEDGKITSYVIPKIYNESVTVSGGQIHIEADLNFTEEK